MIVPQYWAEARMTQRVGNRQITVRRFGWSDSSQNDAQSSAERRVQEACRRIAAGEKLTRREPKIPYNGAEGVPIREEILDRHDDAIITRNSYGAQCLNTPNVLIADIDFEYQPGTRLYIFIIAILIICTGLVGWRSGSWSASIATLLIGLFLVAPITTLAHRIFIALTGGAERRARARIQRFVKKHPDWHLRVYRTPAGFRVLVMHRIFEPNEAEVFAFFQALKTDPLYVRMCKNQQCFRARLSPKPWRIGISAHMRPRPGVWPVDPRRIPARTRWIETYEKAAKVYAACRFVEAIGSNTTHEKTQWLQQIHDKICRADQDLKIA